MTESTMRTQQIWIKIILIGEGRGEKTTLQQAWVKGGVKIEDLLTVGENEMKYLKRSEHNNSSGKKQK